MSYNPTKHLITWPVSIYDIQQAIRNGSGDLGTLNTATTINKWATFKPYLNGTVGMIYRDFTAPFGLRTIYQRVNPYTGAVSQSNNTTLETAVQALLSAIVGQYYNPFLDDLTMYIKPTGGASSAFRQTDYVTTQRVSATGQQRGQQAKHGYKHTAMLRYGYLDQQGAYHGLIGRSLSVNSNGDINTDGNQVIDQTRAEMWGETFYDLDTRLTWQTNYGDENDLCVLDWLQAMYSISSLSLHRALVLFTDDWTEQTGFVAVGVLPWAAGVNTWASAIAGDPTRKWHCIEFLTDANVTNSDFVKLSDWQRTNPSARWCLIPGLIYKNMHVAGNDPYAIGANFQYADTNQFPPYGFNLFIQIRSMGLNTSLKIFVSTTRNPDSIYDYVMNRVWSYEVTAVGSYNIYGNENLNICPSGIVNPNYRPFDDVFTIGETYYVCIWGKKNATDSSQQVIWSQAVVATYDDMLQIKP